MFYTQRKGHIKNNLFSKSPRILRILAQEVSFTACFKTSSKASLMAIQETLMSLGRFLPH